VEVRYLTAERLPFQTPRYGIANDTAFAKRPPAAIFVRVGGTLTMQHLAASVSINLLTVLAAKVGSGTVQVEYRRVRIDQERGYWNRIEYCSVMGITRPHWCSTAESVHGWRQYSDPRITYAQHYSRNRRNNSWL
jgi:hypothetical protein